MDQQTVGVHSVLEKTSSCPTDECLSTVCHVASVSVPVCDVCLSVADGQQQTAPQRGREHLKDRERKPETGLHPNSRHDNKGLSDLI